MRYHYEASCDSHCLSCVAGWIYCRSSQLPDLPTWWRDPSQLKLQEESAPKGADRAPKKGTKSSSGFLRGLRRLAFSGLAILGASGPSLMPLPALAADSFKIGSCLLKNCQLELGRCLLDGKCLANIICLNTCNGKENEVGCQIGCGNLFENEVVGEFNGCALTKKQCVPQKQVCISFHACGLFMPVGAPTRLTGLRR